MLLIILAGVISTFVLLPKIGALTSTWLLSFEYNLTDVLFLTSQDFMVFFIVWILIFLILKNITIYKAILTYIMVGGILILSMIDCRVRELWMHPIESNLILYAFTNMAFLQDGNDLFFKQTSAFGVTLRRLILYNLLSYTIIYTMIVCYLLKSKVSRYISYKYLKILAMGLVVSFFLTMFSPYYEYRYEENFLIDNLVNQYRLKKENLSINVNVEGFDQKPIKISKVLEKERVDLKNVKRFDNLILIVLESVRAKELYSNSSKINHMPFLKRICDEGMATRSYVSVPHSSKAYYSIFTGRYPYPGSMLKEMMYDKHHTIISILKDKYNKKTFAYSGMYLSFENTSKLLSSCGFNTIKGPVVLNNSGKSTVSSFGGCDEKLLVQPFKDINPIDGFVMGLFPFASHYPYLYPEKKKGSKNKIICYQKSLKSVDNWLETLFKKLEEKQMLKDSLVVLVGDHGESFGEHGFFVHNNSMYDEELLVPLIFWSKDKKLKLNKKSEKYRHIDIAPTIADFMDVDSESYYVQGKSILRMKERECHYGASFSNDVSRALVIDQTKFIYRPTSDVLIKYNLNDDPNELKPIHSGDKNEFVLVKNKINQFYYYQRLNFNKN